MPFFEQPASLGTAFQGVSRIRHGQRERLEENLRELNHKAQWLQFQRNPQSLSFPTHEGTILNRDGVPKTKCHA
jgi:hypothetical protein